MNKRIKLRGIFALLFGIFCLFSFENAQAEDVTTVQVHLMNLKTNQDIQAPEKVSISYSDYTKEFTVPQISGCRVVKSYIDYDNEIFSPTFRLKYVSEKNTVSLDYFDKDIYVYYVREQDEKATVTIHWMDIQNNSELAPSTVISGRSGTLVGNVAPKKFSGFRLIEDYWDVSSDWRKKIKHDVANISNNRVDTGSFSAKKPTHLYVYYIKQVTLRVRYIEQNGKSIKADKISKQDVTEEQLYELGPIIDNYEREKQIIEWKGVLTDKTITFRYNGYVTTKFDLYEKGGKKKKKTITYTDVYGDKETAWLYLDDKHESKEYRYTATVNRTIKVE